MQHYEHGHKANIKIYPSCTRRYSSLTRKSEFNKLYNPKRSELFSQVSSFWIQYDLMITIFPLDDSEFRDLFFRIVELLILDFDFLCTCHSYKSLEGINCLEPKTSTLGNGNGLKLGVIIQNILEKLGGVFTIVEIGSGTGNLIPEIISKVKKENVSKLILSDPFNKIEISKNNEFITFDDFFLIKNHQFRNLRDAKLKYNKYKKSQQTICVLSKKMDVSQIIRHIKINNLKNVILLICCPPPNKISTDIIALYQSLTISEIRHIFIVRHECDSLDGSRNFDKFIHMFEYFNLWHLESRYLVCSYRFGCFDSKYYNRYLYHFSRC